MLDLELLRSFVSVVDAGGFTRAGERVHRTQSTVSQQIKRLEDDVGQPLLNRSGKDVTPTEAGERLLSYARRLLALAEEARDVMARPSITAPIASATSVEQLNELVQATQLELDRESMEKLNRASSYGEQAERIA
jgi:DNA-binding transcriptional LysR family regulator